MARAFGRSLYDEGFAGHATIRYWLWHGLPLYEDFSSENLIPILFNSITVEHSASRRDSREATFLGFVTTSAEASLIRRILSKRVPHSVRS